MKTKTNPTKTPIEPKKTTEIPLSVDEISVRKTLGDNRALKVIEKVKSGKKVRIKVGSSGKTISIQLHTDNPSPGSYTLELGGCNPIWFRAYCYSGLEIEDFDIDGFIWVALNLALTHVQHELALLTSRRSGCIALSPFQFPRVSKAEAMTWALSGSHLE